MKQAIFIIALGIVLWICAIGAALGAVGLRYTIKRSRKGLL